MPSGIELPIGVAGFRDERGPELGFVAREMNFPRDAMRLLRRHKALFALTVLLSSAIGAYIALTLPPVYTASSTVMVEASGKEVITLKEVLADVPADSVAISSEVQVLSSRELLEHVAEKLSLVNDPEFNSSLHPSSLHKLVAEANAEVQRWLAGIVTPPPPVETRPMNEVVATLRRHLVIAPVYQSRVIQISFMSRDPRTAADVVNAIAELYTAHHLQQRNEATQQANAWIDERVAELRSRADRSAAAVEQYRAQHGLVRGRDSLLVQQQVSDASSQLTAAQSRRSQAEAALAEAQRALASGHPERVSAVVNSLAIQQLRQQEAQAAARRSDLGAHLGDANPTSMAAAAQLRGIQGQIAAEVNRVVQSLRDAAAVAKNDEAALVARLDEARKQADSANSEDVGLQQLQREANVDNTLYQTFLTRSKETDPQFNFPTVNVHVLSRAVPPDRPVSPNRPLIGIAGVVIGICFGAGLSVARDLVGRGVRTRRDVEKLFGLAPLGVIPFCNRRSSTLEQLRAREAVATLWTRIIASSGGTAPKSVVVTSAVMKEGKTSLARLLGSVVADHGRRVLIIDADLHCASLSAPFSKRGTTWGLAEVIRGEASLASVTVAAGENCHVLPSGVSHGSPARLLSNSGLKQVLREAEQEYDLVIVDSPPVLIGADASLLGSIAEATIVAVRWEHTSRAAVELALRQLMEVGVRCAGLVLSMVEVSKFALYDEATSVVLSRRARRYYTSLAAGK